MALTSGTRIGPYEVTAQIGVGGMGEVYRAIDTNLKRHVAIKVLPASVAGDAERLARFQREAEVLAALNHPNIAQIHGLEKSGDTTALVMELVEGRILADRIAQGAIPIDEALPVARQIAEALEAAHEQGIIHRDLKPANVKVRDDGVVKVLDFGLAKALEPTGVRADLSQSPTITSPAMTQAGLILGTAAYMSPEQARGRAVDRRADLWAFGVVLFEMLTGAQAFQGEDVGDMLAAVVKTEVDWTRLPAATPAAIRTLLRRCLRKDPRQRLGDAAAARLEIEDALAHPAADTAAQVAATRRAALLPVTVAVGLSALVVGLAIGAWVRPSADPPVSSGVARLALPLPPGSELAAGAAAVISPDGARVAYVATQGGGSQLHIRLMGDHEARPVSGTEGAASPFFSPDGQWVGFFADGKLKKASTTSGVVVTLADAGNSGGAWGPDDTIVFRNETVLLEIPAAGGTPRSLQTPEQAAAVGLLQSPSFLPGGKAILVSVTSPGVRTADDRAIGVLMLQTGELKVLLQGGNSPHFLPTGHLAFVRDGKLMAVRLDLERLEPVGEPVEVLAGVRQNNFNLAGSFSCSRGGSCVYVAGGTADQRTVALVDRSGTLRPLPLPPKNYTHPRFSPAGDRLLFWLEQVRCDIEVYDLERGTTTRLASDGDNHYPVWTPDGQRITYESQNRATPDSERVFETVWQLANGGGAEEVLATAQGPARPTSLSWSRSGELAFVEQGDIWLLPRPGEGKPRPFAPSRFLETMPAFSPDGRWLAYVSDESGRFEVYVRPFPGPGERYPISTAGGSEPVWARNGRELFFRQGDQLMAVEIVTQPAFSASRPRLLFTGNYLRTPGRINYDVAPNGSFVMLNPGEEDRAATRIDVLLNWYEELKRLVP